MGLNREVSGPAGLDLVGLNLGFSGPANLKAPRKKTVKKKFAYLISYGPPKAPGPLVTTLATPSLDGPGGGSRVHPLDPWIYSKKFLATFQSHHYLLV